MEIFTRNPPIIRLKLKKSTRYRIVPYNTVPYRKMINHLIDHKYVLTYIAYVYYCTTYQLLMYIDGNNSTLKSIKKCQRTILRSKVTL